MAREQIISINPAGNGWALEWPGSDLALIFRSGASAEEKGRDLGRRLARLGQSSRLVVHDRRGQFVGEIAFPPA